MATSRISGSRANIDGPANLGMMVPFTGCSGVVSDMASYPRFHKIHTSVHCAFVTGLEQGRLMQICRDIKTCNKTIDF